MRSNLLWAYVVDVVGLDRNEIVGVGKWGIVRLAAVRAAVEDDEGCGKGQWCGYVAGEAAIEEEGNSGK
ncbi:hypothetical protein BHM03_00013383 [Ensete ventricosum]|nr:hypothetical protein BHM03_00013383 [Ensete ventricosum]